MVRQVRDLPQMQLTPADFRQFWIIYDQGTFRIGAGAPGCNEYVEWRDKDPIAGIRHVGLAAWDKFMAYRNIQSSAAPEYEPKCMVSSRCTPVRPLTESMHTYSTPRDHSYIRFPPAGRSDSTYLHRDYCPQRLTCGAFL